MLENLWGPNHKSLALIAAAKSGDTKQVEVLLNERNVAISQTNYLGQLYYSAVGSYVDVNAADTQGDTALHLAAYYGHHEIVDLLIASEADISSKNHYNQTALDMAVMHHHPLVENRLRAHENGEILNADGETELHIACKKGHTAEVARLIANGANIHALTDYHFTPIEVAIFMERIEVVCQLIDAGAKVPPSNDGIRSDLLAVLNAGDYGLDTLDSKGLAPLHYATHAANPDVLRYLISKGANPNVVDQNGETPLHHAVKFGRDEIFDILIALPVNLNAADQQGLTPLHYTLKWSQPDMLQKLVSAKVDFSAVDQNGRNALHFAAMYSDLPAVSQLCTQGADINGRDNEGLTPLFWVDTPEALAEFVSRGADVNIVPNNGKTRLHEDLLFETPHLATQLIANGANINPLYVFTDHDEFVEIYKKFCMVTEDRAASENARSVETTLMHIANEQNINVIEHLDILAKMSLAVLQPEFYQQQQALNNQQSTLSTAEVADDVFEFVDPITPQANRNKRDRPDSLTPEETTNKIQAGRNGPLRII